MPPAARPHTPTFDNAAAPTTTRTPATPPRDEFVATPSRYARRLRDRLLDLQLGLGLDDPDHALARDPSIIEKVRRDPVVAKAINQRLHTVAASGWHLQAPNAASRVLVPIFEALLRKVERFTEARVLLARGVFEGMRWARMDGRRATLDLLCTGDRQTWWWPRRLVDVDKRRLRLDAEPVKREHEPGERDREPKPPRYRWRLHDPHADAWRTVEHPEHFVRHQVHGDEGSLGYGRGLLESLSVYWQAKTLLFGYMCEGAERFAYPWIIARLAPTSSSTLDGSNGGIAGGAGYPTQEERADALIASLDKMRQQSILVLDHDDSVETVDLSGKGNALILDLIQYVDRCMVELVLGSSMPTGSGTASGSLARARVEQDSTRDLLAFDREALEDTLSRDLIGALWRYNAPTFRALGLDQLTPPTFRLGTRSRRDPQQMAAIIERAAKVGLPLRTTEVYDALGLTPPDDVPDVLTWSK